MIIFKKILFAILVLNLLQSCGYQPLLTDQNQNFSISAVNIYGDKKLSLTLGNYFSEVEGAENSGADRRVEKVGAHEHPTSDFGDHCLNAWRARGHEPKE